MTRHIIHPKFEGPGVYCENCGLTWATEPPAEQDCTAPDLGPSVASARAATNNENLGAAPKVPRANAGPGPKIVTG